MVSATIIDAILAVIVAPKVLPVEGFQFSKPAPCFLRTQLPLSACDDTVFRNAAPMSRKRAMARSRRYPRSWFTSLFAGPDSNGDDDMSWLNVPPPDRSQTEITNASSAEQDERDPSDLGDVHIPSTGVSVTDELEQAQADQFYCSFVPVKGLPGVAQIVTFASRASFDPVRYLVNLSPPSRLPPDDHTGRTQPETPSATVAQKRFVLTDVPPFSDQLVGKIREFMGPDAQLSAILVTSRDAIHYDEAPAVFTTRRSDLEKWTAAFPGVQVVIYRLDVPRDCRELVTQRLDGYGPWALQEGEDGSNNVTFVETGRPLTYMEWDDETVAKVFDKGEAPPDEEDTTADDHLYTPEAIRSREQDKRVLAVYTPGHTFGSLTYIFPEEGVCCSGFTIPVEDTREEENPGVDSAAPFLDCRGYVTTSKAGLTRQMDSARDVINTYADRFTVVLPARGDPLFLDGDAEERKETLLDIVDQYDKIGQIYEQLGITSSDEDD